MKEKMEENILEKNTNDKIKELYLKIKSNVKRNEEIMMI